MVAARCHDAVHMRAVAAQAGAQVRVTARSGPASAALSMTKPISVLSFAERGSKLKEPTNTRASSTANVFACRLELGRVRDVLLPQALRRRLRRECARHLPAA